MNNGENIMEQAVNRLAEFQSEQSLVTQANSTPLPGPLRDVFAPVQDIVVGPYKVRPMFSRDMEFLQFLENRLYTHFEGNKATMIDFIQPQTACELCYLFTHPVKEIKALFKSGGAKAVKAAAENEFDEVPMPAQIAIVEAVMRQIEINWSSVIGHSAPDENDSKKNISVDGMDSPVMDSVISSNSVVS